MKDRTDPTNRDTVPAMLTPGEFVVNKEATQMYADQLKAMNNNGLALRAKRNGVPGFNEGGIALSDKEKEAMKLIALGESVGESDLGQTAVLWTMLNRGERFNKKQTDWNVQDFETLKNKRKLSDYKEEEVNKISSILDNIVAGNIKDPTGGATHYYANKGDNKIPTPDWAKTSVRDNEASRYDGIGDGVQIGNHFFTGDINKDYAPAVSIVPRTITVSKLNQVPEVTKKELSGSDMFSRSRDITSKFLEAIGKGEALKGAMIPGYNNGGIPMEDDDIMNFIKTYQGKLGDVNPEDVAAGIISDEDLLQNSSDAGANSFMEANEMQYGDPRQSIPMPGAFMGNITDAQSLRAGVVRPDMMPPGYVPPKVTPKQSYKPMPYMDLTNPVNRKMYPEAEGYGLNNEMLAPPGPETKPFFDTSSAYDADGNEIIGDGLSIPNTMNQFARQNIEAQLTLAEKSKLEAERILKNAGTEKERLKAIAMIEKANSDIERYNTILNKDNENYTTVSNVEDRNDLRNSELKLAQLRKERAKYSTDGNPLHLAQLDESIAAEEISINEKKKALNIDDKTTDDNEVKKKTEVLTSRVPISRNLEEAAESGEVEKAGSKVKQGSPQWESAKSFLKDIFGDIFNKKDLVRAITIYLGARIFGASGNQAGAMAGKYYLGKQDAHEANVKAYAASGKYKPSSVALYAKTRNLDDLEAIGKPVVPTGVTKTLYGTSKTGKPLKIEVAEYNLGTNHNVWKRKATLPDGSSAWVTVDTTQWTEDGSRVQGTPEYNAKVKLYYEKAKDLTKEQLTYTDPDDGKEKNAIPGLKPNTAADQLARWAIDNDIDLGSASYALGLAINMAKQEVNRNESGEVKDLVPHLNQAFIVAEVDGTGQSPVAFKNLDGEYISYKLLKDALVNVASIASANNPDIESMNPVMRQTAIIEFAGDLYKTYATNQATDGATDVFLEAAKNNKTTPLYEFMRAYR